MDEARRFLRYVTPGLTFAVEALLLFFIVNPHWTLDRIGYLKKDDVELSAKYPANCSHYIIAAFVFHDVAASARAQNTLSVKALVVHRDNEHGQIWLHRAKVFD
jgi:hypothetical protein